MRDPSTEADKLTPTRLSAISGMFSPGVIRELAKRGMSAKIARLLVLTGISDIHASTQTLNDAYDQAFKILKQRGFRDEYIYRSAVTHKILLGKHSLKTTTMLSEFRAGASKSDMVVLNGHACAFEVKSERDSLARLEKQVEDYSRVFGNVTVICSENHVRAVLQKVPKAVGVMSLSARYQLSTHRDAVSQPDRTDPVKVLECLRSSEAENILKRLGIEPPAVPNTQRLRAMRGIFGKLQPHDVQAEMVNELKHSRSQAHMKETIERTPRSLQAAVLSARLSAVESSRLLRTLSAPIQTVSGWV